MDTMDDIKSYRWTKLPTPGMAALSDTAGKVVGIIRANNGVIVAYMRCDKGPVYFEALKEVRFALLGVFPSLVQAGLAIENEVKLFVKFGRFPNVLPNI